MMSIAVIYSESLLVGVNSALTVGLYMWRHSSFNLVLWQNVFFSLIFSAVGKISVCLFYSCRETLPNKQKCRNWIKAQNKIGLFSVFVCNYCYRIL